MDLVLRIGKYANTVKKYKKYNFVLRKSLKLQRKMLQREMEVFVIGNEITL